MDIINSNVQKNQVFSRYQIFILSKILDLYLQIERAGALNDSQLGFAILGGLQDCEAMAIGAGLSRKEITDYVNFVFDEEAAGDAA